MQQGCEERQVHWDGEKRGKGELFGLPSSGGVSEQPAAFLTS